MATVVERLRRFPSAVASAVKSAVGAARSRGPQRVVLVLAVVVALLAGLTGWFVVTGDDGGEVETAGPDEPSEEASEEPTTTDATTTTAPTTTQPPTTTTTLSEEEQAELEVIDAYKAGVEVSIEASAEPVDPEHPDLEEHFTGGVLNESRNRLESMVNNGWAVRFPEDSEFDIDEIEFRVTFDEVDGVEEAHLEMCWVTDEETYWIANGEPVPHMHGVRNIDAEVVMREIDGTWKADYAPPYESEEGASECDLD